MKRKMYKALYLLTLTFITSSCNETWVEFPLVEKYKTGELYVNKRQMSIDEKVKLITVLSLHNVPFKISSKRILIDIQTAQDSDFVYNMNEKAHDEEWLMWQLIDTSRSD
jgi:hypothetical protein